MVISALFVGAGLVILSYYFNRSPGLRGYQPVAARPVMNDSFGRFKSPFSNNPKEPTSYLGNPRWSQNYTGWI